MPCKQSTSASYVFIPVLQFNEDVNSNSPLVRNLLKLLLVLGIRLHAQTRREDELAHGCAEAG